MNAITVDELTKVLNYRSFLYLLDETLKEDAERHFMLIVWDVAHFKMINDMFGVEAGDEVLKEVAGLFRDITGEKGFTGRIGSDRFVCCSEIGNIGKEEVEQRLSANIHKSNRQLRFIIQAGIYEIRDRNISSIQMCDRAILALNTIKGNFLQRIAFYEDSDRSSLREDLRITAEMRPSIQKGHFRIVVQPIFCSTTGTMVSGEVLVRWNHPIHGMVSPAHFIPILEKNQLIVELDYYVWEQACILIRQRLDQGKPLVPLSVNVSRINLYFDNLVDRLDALLEQYSLPKDALHLEITESAFMENPEQFMSMMTKLHEKGYRILMDDFGIGYSSLKLIKDFPFHILKIDKSLIDEIGESGRAANVVNCIIQMSKILDMNVTAEGVETELQAAQLRDMQCNYIQGFLYSKPLEVDDFLNHPGKVQV